LKNYTLGGEIRERGQEVEKRKGPGGSQEPGEKKKKKWVHFTYEGGGVPKGEQGRGPKGEASVGAPQVITALEFEGM